MKISITDETPQHTYTNIRFTSENVKYFLKHRKVRLAKLYSIRATLMQSVSWLEYFLCTLEGQ